MLSHLLAFGLASLPRDNPRATLVAYAAAIAQSASLSLIPIILLGLWLGHKVRVTAGARLALKRQQIASREMLDSIRDILERYKDPDLHHTLDSIRTGIESSLDSTAGHLKAVTDAASPKITAAIAGFNAAKAAFLESAKPWEEVLNRRYNLPSGLQQVIDDALASLNAALGVPGGNLSAARGLFTSTRENLARDLPVALREWSALWNLRAALVACLKPLLTRYERTWLETEFQPGAERHAACIEPVAANPRPSASEIGSMLQAVHQNHALWPQLARGMDEVLESSKLRLAAAISRQGHGDSPDWRNWIARCEAAVASLRQGRFDEAKDLLPPLREQLIGAILGLAGRPSGEHKDTLDGAFAKDDFEAAIRLIPQARTGPPSEALKFPALPHPRTLSLLLPPRAMTVIAENRPLLPTAPGIAQPTVPPPRQESVPVKSRHRALIAALLGVIALAVLKSFFKGVAIDFLTAFGWAFFAGLSARSLTTALQPLQARLKTR